MAVPVVAAVAPKVVESATNDQGLINQAFKLTILIGLALAVGVGVFLLWRLTGVFAGVFDIIDSAINAFDAVASVPGIVLTAVISASPIGRAWNSVINRNW